MLQDRWGWGPPQVWKGSLTRIHLSPMPKFPLLVNDGRFSHHQETLPQKLVEVP